MNLFNRNNNGLPKKPVVQYDRMDLYRKEKEKKPMTYEELTALQNEKKKDLTNQILRVAGLFAILVLVVLAIGCFLYPYSLFNLFGKGDKFWDCWNNIQYHLTSEKDLAVFAPIQENALGNYYVPLNDGVRIVGHYDEALGAYTQVDSVWVTVQTLAGKAFWGTSAKANFIVLGAWSIIAVATIGLAAILIFASYIVAYNIKDLILVIRHFFKRTGYVLSDIGLNAYQSVDSTMQEEQPKPKTTRKRTTKPKTEAVAPITPEEKSEEDQEDEELAQKMASYKAEIAAEEAATPVIEPVNIPTTVEGKTVQALDNMSDDELDKMLSKK